MALSDRARVWTRNALIIAVFVLTVGLGVGYAASANISKSVPGSITINLVTVQGVADVNRDGRVDQQDLLAVSRKLDTYANFGEPEDLNQDGFIDVLDLATVARFLETEI